MPLRTERILALLQKKLATLDLDRTAADDAKPGEEQIAEELFNAVQDLDAGEYEDYEEPYDSPDDESELYPMFDDHQKRDAKSSLAKITKKLEKLRIQTQTSSVEKLEREIERLRSQVRDSEMSLKYAKEEVEYCAEEMEILKQDEKESTDELDKARKQLRETEAKLKLQRQSLSTARKDQQAASAAVQSASVSYPAASHPNSSPSYNISYQQYPSLRYPSYNGPSMSQYWYPTDGAYGSVLPRPPQQGSSSYVSSPYPVGWEACFASQPSNMTGGLKPAPKASGATSTDSKPMACPEQPPRADKRRDSRTPSEAAEPKDKLSQEPISKSYATWSSTATTMPSIYPTQFRAGRPVPSLEPSTGSCPLPLPSMQPIRGTLSAQLYPQQAPSYLPPYSPSWQRPLGHSGPYLPNVHPSSQHLPPYAGPYAPHGQSYPAEYPKPAGAVAYWVQMD